MNEFETQKEWDLSDWHYLHGQPLASADFKSIPEDFVVTEELGFEPSGEGENLFILIEKKELNTQQVCEYLAKFFNKRLRDIGYAGLKDKQSVSRQWFSVQINVTQQVDLSGLGTEQIKVIRSKRHNKKLKVGTLQANHFRIVLRDVVNTKELIDKLSTVSKTGVPNYFGLQRFGIKGNNLNWANRMVNGEEIRNKKIKGFALSAARSYIFNQVISKRIELSLFDNYVIGDVFNLAGSNSFFCTEEEDVQYQKRLAEFDINITAPLVGSGELQTKQQALTIETDVLKSSSHWIHLLEENGLKQDRRSIRLLPKSMSWVEEGNSLIIEFVLPTGCFATSVLRECVNFNTVGS